MPKHKKTKEEKILADIRRQKEFSKYSSFSYSFRPPEKKVLNITSFSLKKDLTKTVTVSTGIIFFQLLLFVLLHNRLLVLPLVSLKY